MIGGFADKTSPIFRFLHRAKQLALLAALTTFVSSRQESNLYFILRRDVSYPLNDEREPIHAECVSGFIPYTFSLDYLLKTEIVHELVEDLFMLLYFVQVVKEKFPDLFRIKVAKGDDKLGHEVSIQF